ncbi:unnamed protein product [Rotaria sordida]|uniref:Neuropeptide Y n=1 Tax=Rotaria sordida TaxID=392033 RepID=A0A815DHE5_9BILA|nr:unnamed protein product [Rotaria sordida]CAF1298234.1 unnamed protein product [Rotaria sordida]CAF1330815.1 unnamed protein product [Rotaria sordida]CAF1476152.1 unnamed protein product [Rotaria sordida]
MSIIKDKLANRISWIIFIFLAIHTAQVLSGFTDVPPPPPRPERFHSREELKRYLQLVHEYYAIIGRPRFGRSIQKLKINPKWRQINIIRGILWPTWSIKTIV